MVPGVVLELLASTGKPFDAGYATIFDKEKVNVLDVKTKKLSMSRTMILKGWRDHVGGLWIIPLVKIAPGPNIGHVTSQTPEKIVSPP